MPYIGEIRLFAGSFAPAGWAFCDGRVLPISENETLFQLIGTGFGGDGQETFALPDLRSRVPIHYGPLHGFAESGGVESVTVTVNQLPAHTHPLLASTSGGTANSPTGNLTASSPNVDLYVQDATDTNLNAQAIGAAGGSQPHDNLQPFLCINYIIALFGTFPSPT